MIIAWLSYNLSQMEREERRPPDGVWEKRRWWGGWEVEHFLRTSCWATTDGEYWATCWDQLMTTQTTELPDQLTRDNVTAEARNSIPHIWSISQDQHRSESRDLPLNALVTEVRSTVFISFSNKILKYFLLVEMFLSRVSPVSLLLYLIFRFELRLW